MNVPVADIFFCEFLLPSLSSEDKRQVTSKYVCPPNPAPEPLTSKSQNASLQAIANIIFFHITRSKKRHKLSSYDLKEPICNHKRPTRLLSQAPARLALRAERKRKSATLSECQTSFIYSSLRSIKRKMCRDSSLSFRHSVRSRA